MRRIAILLTLALCACSTTPATRQPDNPATAVPSAPNPFLTESTLPFHAPPFDRIKDSDYQPAIEQGMKEQIAEIETVANNPEAPAFDNTIVPMERSGQLLTRVSKVFFNLTGSNTNEVMQKIEAEEAPKLASHQDAIYLNPKLFARVKSLYDRRDSLGLDAQSKYLVERYYKNFVRAGAQLSDADKTTLRALNQEESTLMTQYREKVLAGTKESALVIDNKAELAGLTDADIAAAAQRAKDRGRTNKWVIALQNTTQQPPLTNLDSAIVRRRLLAASEARGNHGGPNDTKAVVARLAQLRAQKARILGYPTYAAYSLDDQMAKTPEAAIKLMTDLVPGSTGSAMADAARMEKLAGGPITAADWQYYAERLRKAEFDLDESQVRPYFELDRVLRDGVFYAANQLYGITFKERKDIPVYQPDVRVFEVFDADGKSLALFYADYFARPNKSGGAWEDTFVDQSGLMGTKPVVFNVTNVEKPAVGLPALLTFTEVTTMFHEFGHALHTMFSDVKYPTLAGTNVPRDFVEFPSQFNEHWALDPQVFANYAKHYQTGQPMPQALVEKIKKSQKFNQGYALTEYLAAALLDMSWHTLTADMPLQDVNTFEPASLNRFNINLPLVPPRYHTTYFSHIWGGGYAAGYYAYLWSEVIDDDAFYWFKEHGGLTRANGQRLRDMILSRGGTEDMATMYRDFRGRDPIVEPLLIERGLKSPTEPTSQK